MDLYECEMPEELIFIPWGYRIARFEEHRGKVTRRNFSRDLSQPKTREGNFEGESERVTGTVGRSNT